MVPHVVARTMLVLASASAMSAADTGATDDEDLIWKDDPGAWHQQLARIKDHRFSTFAELRRFALDAKRAGVSALMLVEIQKTSACPGPWYNGLQLCDHINGSYPVGDGSLAEWKQMLKDIRPMRLMWWVNPTYWSVQGQVWSEASSDPNSDVGRWFSWGDEDCTGVVPCMGRNVVVPSVGCAQGSWGSESGYSGYRSALASFGSPEYAAYMADAMARSWSANLGIDGYCEDVAANYPCMMRTAGGGSLGAWSEIVRRVRRQQPQVVISGESHSSWADVDRASANLGGQGHESFHTAFKLAARRGDASGLESQAAASGADGATCASQSGTPRYLAHRATSRIALLRTSCCAAHRGIRRHAACALREATLARPS